MTDLPDLSHEDFTDLKEWMQKGGGALAATHANDDPESAARSASLGAATGIPSNVIHLDPQNFEARLKQQVTQGIVGGNESLAHYAGSDPMAPIVSNDDWAHLDTLSGMLHGLRQASDVLTKPFQMAAEGLVKGGWEGLKEGWGEASTVTSGDVTKAIPALDPSWSLMGGMENTLLTSVMNAAQLGLRAMSAGFEATTGAVGGAVGGLMGSPQLGRDIKALTEYEMLKPEQMPGGPWLMAGHEPPPGISKDLDKAKAERNETLLKGLEDAASLVQQSKTWERSPELFKAFVQQHLGDRTISIAGDTVAALYGDKVPAPEDGLLGWAPNIGTQVLAAHVDGSDVVIPLADWLTHATPEVTAQLRDNIRMFPEGVTRAESGVERAQVAPLTPSRAKVTLEPYDPEDANPTAFDVKDAQGNIIAFLAGKMEDNKFQVDAISGPRGTDATNKLGVTAVRSILDAVRERFPETTSVGGVRMGGARMAAGVPLETRAMVEQALSPEGRDAVSQVRAAGGLEPVFREAATPVAPTGPVPEIKHIPSSNTNAETLIYSNPDREHIKALIQETKERKLPKGEEHTVRYVIDEKGTHLWDAYTMNHPEGVKQLGTTPSDFGRVLVSDLERKGVDHPVIRDGRAKAQSVGAAKSDHPMIIGLDTIDPKAVGLPEGHWQKLQELAQAQYEDDMSLAQRKAERQAKKRETAEWKANRLEMAKEIEADVRARPDVAADLFIGAGELNGEKLQQRFTLREDDLTPEQKAALPAHYVSKNGFGIDDVATHFGFDSGDALVDALAHHNTMKAGRSPAEMVAAMVKAETDHRMEQKYGSLPENILTAAHDQALSDTTLNLVTQEYQGAAMSAKAEVLTEAAIKDEAKRIANGILNKDVNSRQKLAEVSRHYSDAVKGLLAQDPQAAVVALQRRAIGAHVARELLEREKANAQTEALMKKLAKWKEPGKNEVKSVDPEYVNWAHVIMDKVGQKIRRSMDHVREDIAARRDQTLEAFVAAKTAMLREVPVWDQLYADSWRKDWKQLNGEEARAVGDSLKTLDHHGRDELKVTREGEVADRGVVIGKMVEQTDRFERKPVDIAGNRTDLIGRLTHYPRQFMVNVLQMETFLNYMDKFNPRGVWSQYVMRGLVDGSNQADAWAKEFTKHLADANDGADLSKKVDNPLFRVPWKDGNELGPLFSMTRENLRMVLLNAGNSVGNRSNLVKMAKGYGVKPEEIMAWLHQHATKEDWDWAQKVWDNVFERMWGHGAAMYRSLTGGVAPTRVKITPIQTPFGEYRGGYMPVDYHAKFGKQVGTDLDTLAQSNYQSALPQASWAKERTNAHGPINLDMSRLPMLITRELHDIAMRPSLIQASKLLLDSRVQDVVSSKMGTEYSRMFQQYLVGVANRQNYLTTHPAYANSMLEGLRKNLVTGLVGFNIGTVMKHAPTAFVLTAREIGPDYMSRAYKALYNLNHETSQAAFDLTNSFHELQRRDRNWEETLYGETLKARPGGRSETWTNQLAKYSSKPVAWSDMFSARAAGLGAYMKAIDEGYEKGDAVYMAERAVRRAHGSTALTNRSQVMRDWNPWFTSVYTFFNDIVNRQMEMVWRAGEMLRDSKTEGGWEAAKAHVPAITATFIASVIAPAIIEELVSPSGGPASKDEGLGTKIVKGGIYTLSSGLPGVRDFVHGILSGTDPTPAGLAKTAAGDVQNVWRDLTQKKEPWSKAHAQQLIKDSAGLLAMMSGKVTQSMGNVAAFGYGYAKGQEHPKDPWGWVTGLRYGKLKGHSASFGDWMAGKAQK